MKKTYIQERLIARGKEQQERQPKYSGNKFRKNIVGLKELKIKIIKKKEK